MKLGQIFERLLRITLRTFFYLLYHPLAWTYDGVAALVSLGRWSEWVQSALQYSEGERILEIGHGPGHLQVALQSPGRFIIGLDRSFQMSRQAYRRLRRAGIDHPGLIHGAAQSLPFLSGEFSSVVATFPTDYIVHPDTLSEIYRVLLPGGSLVVIPVAWITGPDLVDHLAAGLFKVTGQTPDWDETFLSPFKQTGFIVRTERIAIRNSQVMVIQAKKKDFE